MLIIPTYNERENIEELVGRIRKSAGSEPIFFVDDNSPDGTADEIRRLQQQDDRICLMERRNNKSYASSCRDAMKKILRENLAGYLIQADADLSHPPEALPQMIELLRTHPVVIGSRYVPGGGTRNWAFERRWLSSCANLYARLLTGVPVHDMTAGFVGYQAGALRKIDLDKVGSEGYAFLMELKFSLHRIGFHFHEFPILFVERESGVSKFNRKIILEGARFPLKAMLKRLRG